jgi:RimJ/RimL family protein N-acetyltransferase
MQIRTATLVDLSSIFCLLSQMHEEPEIEVDEMDWFKVSHIATECIKKNLILVAETKEDGIIGSIGGETMTEWYSTTPVLADYWFYVLPEHRKTAAAFKLMKAFKDIADENNIQMKVGYTLGNDPRKDKLYEKLGFEKLGTLFKRNNGNGRCVRTEC